MLLAQDTIDVNQGIQASRQNAGSIGSTPLFQACYLNRVAVVKQLLAHGAIDVNQGKGMAGSGASPLYAACQEGHEAVVKLLLAHSAVDVNQANTIVGGSTPLAGACNNGHEAVVKLLLAHAAIDVNRSDSQGRGPLFIASASGRAGLVRLLLDKGADTTAMAMGYTPMAAAVAQGHKNVAAMLSGQ